MERRTIKIAMNGVTGRMGYRQHLLRSVLAIRAEGGVELSDGSRVQLDPVLVGRSDHAIDIAVRDDGRGFDVDGAIGRGDHLGLVGMRERASAWRGMC